MENQALKVTQDPEKPVEKEILATAIVRISTEIKRLRESGINQVAIIILLRDKLRGRITPLPSERDLEVLFANLAEMSRVYCEPVKR